MRWPGCATPVSRSLSRKNPSVPDSGCGLESRLELQPTESSLNISMYQTSAPRFVNILKNLSAILDKAQAYAEAKKIDPTVLTSSRLYPDMLPMARQVQIAADTAKGAMARLAGVEIPK